MHLGVLELKNQCPRSFAGGEEKFSWKAFVAFVRS
jgi:hypothetical protein